MYKVVLFKHDDTIEVVDSYEFSINGYAVAKERAENVWNFDNMSGVKSVALLEGDVKLIEYYCTINQF